MNKISLYIATLFFTIFTANISAGDITKGKEKSITCVACHGQDGISVSPIWPKLAGQHQSYLASQLHEFKKGPEGKRNNAIMYGISLALSNEDIDNILAYSDYIPPKPAIVSNVSSNSDITNSNSTNDIILILLSFVLIVLIILLVLINKTLKNLLIQNGLLIDEKNNKKGIPIGKAFVQNQFLVIVSVVILLLSSTYFAFQYMLQIGVDQGYMPIQPIHYSHKIHAGDNQIECQYCHSSAKKSKHSGIPSLNVCMNCHENIAEYNGEEDLEKGYTRDFYTNEIKKLYKAVGWDENSQSYTEDTEPVKWVRIHNLPDFVYFSHAQHVTVAGVDCQKCHGPVEEMEVLYQHSPLTMGWCLNCHKETNIKVKDNEYYTKIHEELSKKYGVEELTVAQMGGLECGKCHY